jgi:hypothetical protein
MTGFDLDAGLGCEDNEAVAPAGDLLRRLEAARLEHRALAQGLEEARARLQAIVAHRETGHPERGAPLDSDYARVQDRLESLPLVEQAKGIFMAQHQCGPDEALDLLRRASERLNVDVRVLAAQVIEQVASPADKASAQPSRAPGLRGAS